MLARVIASIKGDRHRPSLIHKIAFENFNSRFVSEGENAWLSTDRTIVKEYNDDPLCGYMFTANGFTGLFDLMLDTYSDKGWNVHNPSLPIHFIAGADDPCITSCKDFDKAVEDAFAEGKTVMAEGAIVGRELTCAVYFNGTENVALPVIEIITENEFFDYEAKYNGHSREVCPAQIPEALREEIQSVSKKIYTHLGCSGLVRVDYIASEEGLYFLEVNTIPGMTSASLVPQMVRAAGLSMTDFLTTVIENS